VCRIHGLEKQYRKPLLLVGLTIFNNPEHSKNAMFKEGKKWG
jgi:hypothetical protein